MIREDQERIIAAAHHIGGITYSMPPPARHHTVLHAMDDHNADLALGAGPESQGFLTSKGRFVGRVEGASIAIAAKQIEALNWPPYLYSEDVW